jgi:uncharacterized protein (DUF1015 family)
VTQIRAFRPYVVAPQHAIAVVSPAYDSMSPAQRRIFCETHPKNYINTMQAADDFPISERPTEAQVLEGNARQLQAMLKNGSYRDSDTDAVFIYQLSIDGHTQTGVVAEIPVGEYQNGSIRRHEETRKEHEERLSRYLDIVGASSSPICLAYAGSTEIDAIVESVTQGDPVLDFVLPDGVCQRLWRVTDASQCDGLCQAFSGMGATYLTDGHHRAASTLRHAASRRATGKTDGPWDYLLVALFPADQLRVLAFNRCVRDLGGRTTTNLLTELAKDFVVEPISDDHAAEFPAQRGQFLMLLDGQTILLTLRRPVLDKSPMRNLDVSILQERILEPLLGISDVRGDPRLDYVTGDSGLEGLRARCSEGWQLGFACFPTSLTELMAVADASEVMPPKSTCFDPKPRSGIFVRMS